MTVIREAVGVFEDRKELDAAIRELEGTSFPRYEISVLNDNKKGEQNISTVFLEDDPAAPRNAPVRPEEKTIGAAALIGCPAYILGCIAALSAREAPTMEFLASIATGSVAGAIIGAAVVYALTSKARRKTETRLNKGGLLLWVKTPDIDKEQMALNILERHGAKHVHIHDIA